MTLRVLNYCHPPSQSLEFTKADTTGGGKVRGRGFLLFLEEGQRARSRATTND